MGRWPDTQALCDAVIAVCRRHPGAELVRVVVVRADVSSAFPNDLSFNVGYTSGSAAMLSDLYDLGFRPEPIGEAGVFTKAVIEADDVTWTPSSWGQDPPERLRVQCDRHAPFPGWHRCNKPRGHKDDHHHAPPGVRGPKPTQVVVDEGQISINIVNP